MFISFFENSPHETRVQVMIGFAYFVSSSTVDCVGELILHYQSQQCFVISLTVLINNSECSFVDFIPSTLSWIRKNASVKRKAGTFCNTLKEDS